MDKRDRSEIFRNRLRQAMDHAGTNQSELARATGADRSTWSQVLQGADARLPGAQQVAEAARVLSVSTDWLLGLTDRPERPGDLIAAEVGVTNAERASVDEHLLAWHQEAAGYKIRHVPATLPDILKTEEMLRWEYGASMGKTPDQAIGATLDRMNLLRTGTSDYEIAVPLHELDALASGTGYYSGLPLDVRRAQMSEFARLCRDLYPSLRLFLFDAHRLFSAPMTVFGPILGVIYVGRCYLAFRSEDRVKSLTQHFDWLVRECDVDARDVAGHMEAVHVD